MMSLEELKPYLEKAIEDNPKVVHEYRYPKALNYLIGQVMKIMNNRADPQVVRGILRKALA